MPKFRKKPVVIEAEQFLWDDQVTEHPTQMPDGVTAKKIIKSEIICQAYGVQTLGGFIECKDKDWIITGVEGEIYPCKDEIFRETYQQVNGIDQGVEIE